MGFMSIFLIICIPVLILIGAFIGAAIVHVCLMIVGGAKQPFETTLRTLCYANGSTHLLNIVPICGGMIALVASHHRGQYRPGANARNRYVARRRRGPVADGSLLRRRNPFCHGRFHQRAVERPLALSAMRFEWRACVRVNWIMN